MCGIFGYIGKPQGDEKEFRSFLSRLAVFTSERGMHSTGYAAHYLATDRRPETSVDYKRPGSATQFVRSNRWKGLLAALPDSMIGHTRYATGGPAARPKINRNNHPFVGDNFAIVHNGHVSNNDEIEAVYEIGHLRRSATDSETILLMHELCGELALGAEEVLYAGEGGIAVAALDLNDGRIALYRNAAKPMVVAWVPRWQTVVYASTETILARALVNSPTQGRDRAAYYSGDAPKGASNYWSPRRSDVSGITDWYDRHPESYGQGGSFNGGSGALRLALNDAPRPRKLKTKPAPSLRDDRGFVIPSYAHDDLVRVSNRIVDLESGRIHQFDPRADRCPQSIKSAA